jgi:hypothetical protein
MLKRVFGVKRRAGVRHDELVAVWRDEHVPNVVRDLAPDRYTVSFFRQRDDTAFDGMAILGYDDEERGRAAFRRSEPLPAAFRDGLVERSQRAATFDATTEHVQVDGPRGPFKSVVWVTKRPGVPMADLVGHWREVHAPNIAAAAEGIGGFRYVVSIAEDLGDEAPYHGIAEFWYDDAEAWKAHGRHVRPDGFEDLAEMGPGTRLIGEELVVL